MKDGTVFFMYDFAARKVGCVLIQAACGCSSSVANLWETELWATAPTDDMVMVRAKWQQVIRMADLDNRAAKAVKVGAA